MLVGYTIAFVCDTFILTKKDAPNWDILYRCSRIVNDTCSASSQWTSAISWLMMSLPLVLALIMGRENNGSTRYRSICIIIAFGLREFLMSLLGGVTLLDVLIPMVVLGMTVGVLIYCTLDRYENLYQPINNQRTAQEPHNNVPTAESPMVPRMNDVQPVVVLPRGPSVVARDSADSGVTPATGQVPPPPLPPLEIDEEEADHIVYLNNDTTAAAAAAAATSSHYTVEDDEVDRTPAHRQYKLRPRYGAIAIGLTIVTIAKHVLEIAVTMPSNQYINSTYVAMALVYLFNLISVVVVYTTSVTDRKRIESSDLLFDSLTCVSSIVLLIAVALSVYV